MLRQELAFIKAISSIEVYPVFLRELKAAAAGKRKKALAATKASVESASALEHPSRVGEAHTSHDSAAQREQENSRRTFQLRLPV